MVSMLQNGVVQVIIYQSRINPITLNHWNIAHTVPHWNTCKIELWPIKSVWKVIFGKWKKVSEGNHLGILLVKYENDSSSHFRFVHWLTEERMIRRTDRRWTIPGNNTSAELKLKAELKLSFVKKHPSVQYSLVSGSLICTGIQ